MKFTNSIQAIDMHTMGEPTRILISGLPAIRGKTMAAKKAYLAQNLDYIRTAVMLEPRGHRDMFGAVLTEPVSEGADFGVVFMDSGGYLNMCAHGSIGVATAVIATGMLPLTEPITEVVLDTPAGIIKAKATLADGRVKSVAITNVAAFYYKSIKIDTTEFGKIDVDISFGGSFFALVNATQLGIKVTAKNTQKLIKAGLLIRDIVNKQVEVEHPEQQHIKTVDLVKICDQPTHPQADYKNAVIFGQGQIDRSPCGTGVSAKMAVLHSKGKIKKGETFFSESVLGTLFAGKVVGIGKLGNYETVVPEITGSAYITGFNHLVIDEDDPLKHGFILQ